MVENNKFMKIAEVCAKTGVSRELIHHYLRQGLLPKSSSRAQYSDEQVRLLKQIKSLRDDHHLPLEVIRGVFEFFAFNPENIEALTQADSLSGRMTRLATEGEVLSSRTVTADALVALAGISLEQLERYREAQLIRPTLVDGQEHYSSYDARVIALCEHGARLEMPFESLRTIGSYVRVAFALEHPTLLDVSPNPQLTSQRLLGDMVARLEVVTSFIQSLLQSLISHHLRDMDAQKAPVRDSLDNVVYRPSESFVRRHALDALRDRAQEVLCVTPADPKHWVTAGRILLHTGQYNEAAFTLEQALLRWPKDDALETLYGRALLLSGRPKRALEILGRADAPHRAIDCALARVAGPEGGADLSTLIRDAAEILAMVDAGLEHAGEALLEDRLRIQLFGGWLLTVLPPTTTMQRRGVTLLTEVVDTLERLDERAFHLPGLWHRYRINAAYLLFDALRRTPDRAHLAPDVPTPETLRTRICRLDPGCLFSNTVFLQPSAPEPGATPGQEGLP